EEVFIDVNVLRGTSGKEDCILYLLIVPSLCKACIINQFDLLLPPLCHFPLCQQNSGFDLSGAEISGNFAGGGPAFYSLQK
uniref:Uncharacterized protein n=1 Tax=Oncorhynchus tshawytscha TaxID=74940 RepID=A0AAZ3QNS7_ONCTS